MSGNFALYSTDIDPTLTPWTADPAPAQLIRWDNDVDEGDYTPPRRVRRGSVIQTGGGNVVTDMGIVVTDGRITASGTVDGGTWISTETAEALQAAYEDDDTTYYFTDGVSVWEVRFLPGDENAPELTMNLSLKIAKSVELWSWSIVLMTLEEVTP